MKTNVRITIIKIFFEEPRSKLSVKLQYSSRSNVVNIPEPVILPCPQRLLSIGACNTIRAGEFVFRSVAVRL